MKNDQLAGLELPLRVLAWEAENGCTWLGYNSSQTIVDGLDLHDVDDVICMMTNALDALTEYAVKEGNNLNPLFLVRNP